MISFDVPSVSVGKKTNEQNVQALKSWAFNVAESLNYQLNQYEQMIASLQSQINELKEKV